MKSKLIILILLLTGCATSDYTRDEKAELYIGSYVKYISTGDPQDKKAAMKKWNTYIKHK